MDVRRSDQYSHGEWSSITNPRSHACQVYNVQIVETEMLYHLQLSLTHLIFLWWLYQHWSCVSDYQPKSAIESALPVTFLIGSMISHQQLTLEVLKTHWHYYIFQDWKCIQHTIINSFLGLLYCRPGWSGSPTFTHALIHANFTIHSTGSSLFS